MITMVAFHEQLQKIMKEKGITQSELCKRTGIPKSAMSQYISGAFKPKQKRTYLIAKALNVSEAWLIGMENAEQERREPQQINQDIRLTDHEKEVIIAYRQKPHMQNAVDTLLDVTPEEEKKEKDA